MIARLLQQARNQRVQLTVLTTLNLSLSNLEQYPSILRWNCPKLRDLNLSHNKLLDSSEKLLKQMRRANVDYMADSADRHSQPQQKLLQLTGHNLYPCVYSLKTVDLSHNSRLSQLPDWVCVLPNLALLNLQGLPKLKQLPHQLAIWSSLAIIRMTKRVSLSHCGLRKNMTALVLPRTTVLHDNSSIVKKLAG